MKTLLPFILLFSLLQAISAEASDSLFIKKAKHKTYLIDKDWYDTKLVVYDQEQPPPYTTPIILNNEYIKEIAQKYNILARPPRIYLSKSAECDKMVIKCIRPYIKKEDFRIKWPVQFFRMRLIADSAGRIKAVYFFYPRNIDIPLTKIEKLDLFIRKNCSLTYRKTKVMEGADNIPFDLGYTIEELYYNTIDSSKPHKMSL